MCWLDILWQTIIENFANQLQNSKVLFLKSQNILSTYEAKESIKSSIKQVFKIEI